MIPLDRSQTKTKQSTAKIVCNAYVFNSLSAAPKNIQDPVFFITLVADALASNGARPKPGTMLTAKLEMLCPMFS